MVDGDDLVRVERPVARNVEHGRAHDEAVARVRDVDGPDAALIRATADRADRMVRADGR